MPQRESLVVPQVEALHVEFHAIAALATALHDELRLQDDLLANVAGLPVPRATPDAGDAVVRQTTVSELVSNE
jgi:hypothetical protein